jgi:peptide deformylase
MIKEIVRDTEFLSQPLEPATAADAAVAQDLVDTMTELSENCACLAANQIGSNKAVIAYADDEDRIHVMFNPRITASMSPYGAVESCLSLEGESAVKRFQIIRVAYQELVNGELVDRQRKLVGWPAQVVQHAVDHCKGHLV